jgi:hypothetical protein
MKKTLISFGMLCLLASCKKSDNPTNPNVLKIQVSNIGAYTNYLISPVNYTHPQNYSDINGKKDSTYSIAVSPGDKLTVLYNIDYIPPNTDGFLGTGTIKFIYNGNNIGAVSNGEGNTNVNIPVQ